jgi:fibronectin type 3 domain-containing protein
MKHLLFLLALLPLAAKASAPVIVSSSIVAHTPLCAGQSSTIYEFMVTDAESDPVSITSIVSSNGTVISGTSVTSGTQLEVGNATYFYVYGTPSSAGTFTLTVTVSDGSQQATLNFPVISVQDPTPPAFTQTPITLCSGTGIFSFQDFVTTPGGHFESWDLEQSFGDGTINTDDPPFSTGTEYSLHYTLETGNCSYDIDGSFIMNESGYIGVSTTPTTCGESDGQAELIIDAPSPHTIQWSNGAQNVDEIEDLPAGSYSVSLTTQEGCVNQKFFTIEVSDAEVSADITGVLCYGQSNGSVELSMSGLVAPYSILWSSGHSTQDLTNVPAGYYTVNITDANGCSLAETFEVTTPEEMYLDGFVNEPACGSPDGSIEVDQAYGGTGEFTFNWNTGASGQTLSGIPHGIYSVTATDENGCMQVRTFYVSDDDAANINGSINPATCNGNDGSIMVEAYPVTGSSVESVQWSNGSTQLNLLNVSAANYVCTLVTDNSCTAIRGWDIPVVAPLQNNICVVTVDDETTTNLVVWEKLQTTGIDYYNIYRETSVPNNFALIDTVHADGDPIFNDVVASPLERSWRYKIAAVNVCGVESPLSLPHQTIHLDVLANISTGGVTVAWNPYAGTSFSGYNVSRYTDANGWEDIPELPSTQLTYEDDVPITAAGLDYVVSIDLEMPCSAEKAQDFNSSRSNKDKAQFNPGEGTGDSNNGITEFGNGSVGIYPNPAGDGKLFAALSGLGSLSYRIHSAGGQLISEGQISEGVSTIDVSEARAGMYFITFFNSSEIHTVRFAID